MGLNANEASARHWRYRKPQPTMCRQVGELPTYIVAEYSPLQEKRGPIGPSSPGSGNYVTPSFEPLILERYVADME